MTNDEYISVTFACNGVSYLFLSSNLDSLVETHVDSTHKTPNI